MTGAEALRRTAAIFGAGVIAGTFISRALPSEEAGKVNPPQITRQIPEGLQTTATIKPRETPPSGWREYPIKRYDRLFLRLQLPEDWNIREQDQEVLVESKATQDLSQMVSIRILMRLNPFESNTFAESIADDRAVEDKNTRSPFKLNIKGKEVLSFVRKNETANQGMGIEEHIFGFTFNGVGVAIIIDAPSNRIRDEKGNFQRILDHTEPISTSSQK